MTSTNPNRLTLEEAAERSGLSYGRVYRRVVQNAEIPSQRIDGRWTIAAEDAEKLKPYVAQVDPRPGVTLRVSPEEWKAWKRSAGRRSVSKWLLELARKASGWE